MLKDNYVHSRWSDLKFDLVEDFMHALFNDLQILKGSDKKQLRKSGVTIHLMKTIWGLYVAMETRVLTLIYTYFITLTCKCTCKRVWNKVFQH